MSYHKGQILPLERTHAILGARLPQPLWHALYVPPNKDRASTETLKAHGCFAFYPQRTKSWWSKGKKMERTSPQISGMIYAKFTHEPRWHSMRRRGLVTGVVSIGERPVAIPSEIVRRLQGLPGRAEALAQAKAELLRVAVGDRAMIPEGPLAGQYVQVDSIGDDGRVWWAKGIIRGSSEAGTVVRDGQPSEGEVQARADEIMEDAQQGVA